jgi:hypothetical protein
MSTSLNLLLALAVAATLALAGCKGKSPDEAEKKPAAEGPGLTKVVADKVQSGGEKASEYVGSTLNKAATGFARGIEGAALTSEVRVSDTLDKQGIRATRVQASDKKRTETDPQTIDVYVTATEVMSGTLVLKAFDKDDREVGRSLAAVTFTKDDARYVAFDFDARVPLAAVKYFTLDRSSATPPATTPATTAAPAATTPTVEAPAATTPTATSAVSP